MKVLVVGGGGREHAICEKVAESNFANVCFWAPGNKAIEKTGRIKPIDIPAKDTEGLIRFSKDNSVNLIIPGPEQPLCDGFVNEARKENLKTFGPVKEAAILEDSKVFAKEFMKRHKIPTADFKVANNVSEAMKICSSRKFPFVVKADGLAMGKGVYICESTDEAISAITEIMVIRKYGKAGDRIVIEDFIPGEEASYIIIVDVEGNILPLASSQDHKQVFDGDKGPNTGGNGSLFTGAGGNSRNGRKNSFPDCLSDN